MLELIIIWRLAVSIGNLALQKGLKKVAYQIMAITLWISGEIFGFIVGSLIFGDNGLLGQYFLGLLGAAIGAGIAFLVMHFIPNPGQPDSIETAIDHNAMSRVQKFGRSGCIPAFIVSLTFFCVIGPMISLRVWMSLNSDSFTNAPADVENPILISREGFELKYPGNWMVEVKDGDYDPDHTFKIEGPVDGFGEVMFIIMDTQTDPAYVISQMESEQTKTFSGTTLNYFTNWGNYVGQGVTLQGHVPIAGDVVLRTFVYSSSMRSFIIVEMFSPQYEEIIKPGFQLIEDSFLLKE